MKPEIRAELEVLLKNTREMIAAKPAHITPYGKMGTLDAFATEMMAKKESFLIAALDSTDDLECAQLIMIAKASGAALDAITQIARELAVEILLAKPARAGSQPRKLSCKRRES
ncbi:MAG TPA: hypothetical protein VNH84_06820 [Candidatus Saccharimonadales bacterium]|nr:hypothetical protein [Candidatus Saccharimonadales bacterium]